MQSLRFKPAERLFILLISLVVCALIGSIITGFVIQNGITTKTLRLATVIQDCVIFVLPTLITAIIISPYPAKFLCVDTPLKMEQALPAVIGMIVSIPIMNWIVAINDTLSLPDALSDVENWMRIHENEAREAVKILLGESTVGSLIVDILIVGVLAGFSEEILFRGGLQRIFCFSGMNRHVAIWLTAIIFSAIHLQFFGFFPRLLLGAYFGYLLLWSKSIWLPVLIHALNNSIVVYSTWSQGFSETSETMIDDFGVGSPIILILSGILTLLIITRLHNISKNIR